MSRIGAQKADIHGRSSGRYKTNGAMKIVGQFIPRPVNMLSSPAYRVLSLSAHRVLARVEIEHASHGGFENGDLPVTFADFERYGVDRHAIGPAIAECVALGFLRITHHGRSGNGAYRSANRFRLTYLPLRGVAPTHGWKHVETDGEARTLARASRARKASVRSRYVVRPSLQDIDSGGYFPTAEAVLSGGYFPPGESAFGGETPTGGRGKPPLGSKFSPPPVSERPALLLAWTTPRVEPIERVAHG